MILCRAIPSAISCSAFFTGFKGGTGDCKHVMGWIAIWNEDADGERVRHGQGLISAKAVFNCCQLAGVCVTGAQWLIRFTFSYALTGPTTQASQQMWRAVSQSTMGF
jgi:hypothetical protein